MTIWAAQWHSCSRLDGDKKHLLCEDCLPMLFKTRREARDYIKKTHGYIATRPDLQAEPHGWRMPQAIKVIVEAGE